jgi:MarR family transcriptional regulator for hemolysin
MPKVTPSVADDAEGCARDLLEVVPLASRWLRAAVRRREPTWSLPQLMAMGYLRLKPDASLSDLANHLGVGLPTASTLVSRLVSVNHVNRRDDPAERRRALLRLTSKGERQLDAALADTEAELAERLRTLRPRELTHLRQGLAVLHTLFGDA